MFRQFCFECAKEVVVVGNVAPASLAEQVRVDRFRLFALPSARRCALRVRALPSPTQSQGSPLGVHRTGSNHIARNRFSRMHEIGRNLLRQCEKSVGILSSVFSFSISLGGINMCFYCCPLSQKACIFIHFTKTFRIFRLDSLSLFLISNE
jgi:hypothetical protein